MAGQLPPAVLRFKSVVKKAWMAGYTILLETGYIGQIAALADAPITAGPGIFATEAAYDKAFYLAVNNDSTPSIYTYPFGKPWKSEQGGVKSHEAAFDSFAAGQYELEILRDAADPTKSVDVVEAVKKMTRLMVLINRYLEPALTSTAELVGPFDSGFSEISDEEPYGPLEGRETPRKLVAWGGNNDFGVVDNMISAWVPMSLAENPAGTAGLIERGAKPDLFLNTAGKGVPGGPAAAFPGQQWVSQSGSIASRVALVAAAPTPQVPDSKSDSMLDPIPVPLLRRQVMTNDTWDQLVANNPGAGAEGGKITQAQQTGFTPTPGQLQSGIPYGDIVPFIESKKNLDTLNESVMKQHFWGTQAQATDFLLAGTVMAERRKAHKGKVPRFLVGTHTRPHGPMVDPETGGGGLYHWMRGSPEIEWPISDAFVDRDWALNVIDYGNTVEVSTAAAVMAELFGWAEKFKIPAEAGFYLGPLVKYIKEFAQILSLFEPGWAEALEAAGIQVETAADLESEITGDPSGLGEDLPAEPKEYKSRAATIWDQQCFLIENMKQIKDARKVLDAAGGFINKRYSLFGRLNGSPGNLVSKLHHGDPTKYNPVINSLLNITPEEYALLTPYIKLYRVVYEKDNPLKVKSEQEMPFESFTGREDIENIFKNRAGRQAGAGIQSFEWDLQGVQPAEVDYNITATLTVHFQSLHDLFRYNTDKDSFQAGLENPGFLDLIMAPQTVQDIEKSSKGDNASGGSLTCDDSLRKYEGELYRIKAVIGWSVPEGLDRLPGVRNAAALVTALEEQQKTLFLQLARHNIDFHQDGSVKLIVNYQAALASMMQTSRTDIFKTQKELEDPFAPGTKLNELKEQKESEAGLTPSQEEEYKKLLDEASLVEKTDRLVRYRQVLKYIFETGRMNTLRLPMVELLLTPYSELTPERRASRARRRQSSNAEQRGYAVAAGGALPDNNLYEQLKSATAGDNLDEIQKNLNSLEGLGPTPGTAIDLNYFYFGDLIESILQLPHLREQIQASKFALVLGSVQVLDPLVALTTKNLNQIIKCGDLTSEDNQSLTIDMNIADIPISLDAFSEWFLQSVVKRDKDSYYLNHFIRDVLGSLVTYALSPRCHETIPHVPTRFATSEFFMKRRFNPFKLYDVTTAVQMVKKKNISLTKASSNVPTLFVYCSDALPTGFKSGNAADDLSEGIYHFYLGASAGLVKEVTFNREDQAYLREAKIQRRGTLGPEQLRELYSVKLRLVGNTLLKNGQFIYINPVAIGAGSPSAGGTIPNIARLLGLGGYFLVTGVNHRLQSSGFEVEVTALHQAMRMQKPSAEFKIESYEIDAEQAPGNPSWNAPPAEAPDATPPTVAPPAAPSPAKPGPEDPDGNGALDIPAAAESISGKSGADIAAEAAAAEEARKCEALATSQAGGALAAWLEADCK